jgi:hypothetical protein
VPVRLAQIFPSCRETCSQQVFGRLELFGVHSFDEGELRGLLGAAKIHCASAWPGFSRVAGSVRQHVFGLLDLFGVHRLAEAAPARSKWPDQANGSLETSVAFQAPGRNSSHARGNLCELRAYLLTGRTRAKMISPTLNH